ncbi:MAG: polyketide synthase [Kiritimatiellae bacterium]|nr:polyketide synthase [Kiritimatiellia bacterium]
MDNRIAIVGMSCRFAGCPSLDAFWDVIMSRRSMLTIPGTDVELPIGQQNVFKRPYPTRIGQLGDLFACVPSMQTFPRQINAGENQDLYFATQLAFDALADASMRPRSKTLRSGAVRLGYAPPFNASTMNWLQHTAFLDQTLDIIKRFFPHAPDEQMQIIAKRLSESLPAPNAASFLMGSGYRFVSWIARETSFGGGATILDAGMVTGAAAIRGAVNDLVTGHCDVALAGAITPPLSRAYLEGVSGEVDFSDAADFTPFAEEQKGTVPGEGGAFFVLKRREDALKDHDRIYATIRATTIGHNPESDPAFLFKAALAEAQIPEKSIELIEADGSGVKRAEDREIAAIQSIWGEHRPGGPLVGVGSVKGNIGHTLRASMAAGIVKTALALHHKVLAPQVVVPHPSSKLSNIKSSAYLIMEPRPWIARDSANPRRAAVMGANFDPVTADGIDSRGGRSSVMILEEEPEERR